MTPHGKDASRRAVRARPRAGPSRADPREVARQFALDHPLALALGAGLILASLAVWQLRQPWMKTQFTPWLVLVLGACLAGYALTMTSFGGRKTSVTRHIVAPPASRKRRLVGLILVAVSILLTGFVVLLLWPNIGRWQGLPVIWFMALAAVLIGAWLIGPSGSGSSRNLPTLELWRDTPMNRWLEAGAVAAIFALAIFLRTYRLDSIPPGIFVDETNGALDAVKILEGQLPSPFATGWFEVPSGYFYFMALLFKLAGADWFGLKLASVIPAVLTIPAVYLLARELFGSMPALAAMFFMAVSRWHLTMSRWGWVEITAPLLQVLAVWFLVRGFRRHRALDFGLSGLVTGLSIYTYLSARLGAVIIILYLMGWVLTNPAGMRAAVRSTWRGILLFLAAALVAVAPLAVTYLKNPFVFGNRTSQVTILRDVRSEGSLMPIARNVGDTLRSFHQAGDRNGRHNLPGEPMTDPFTGLFLVVGIVIVVITWRDHRSILLLLWLVVGLATSYLGARAESPQGFRSVSVVPAVALLAGVAVARLAGFLLLELRRSHVPRRVARSRPLIVGGLAAIVFAGATIWESRIYFGPQAVSPAVIGAFSPVETHVAFDAVDSLRAGKAVYLSTGLAWMSQLRFLVYGQSGVVPEVSALDKSPYGVITAQQGFPLSYEGRPAAVFLESQYQPMQGYFASFYPQAGMEMVQLPSGAPLYFRIDIPEEQLQDRLGLKAQTRLVDGHIHRSISEKVEFPEGVTGIQSASWQGLLRVPESGEYFLGGDGLDIALDGAPWAGRRFLGSGLYGILVKSAPAGRDPTAVFLWQPPAQQEREVPPEVLFHVDSSVQGLRASYFDNTDWSGAPIYAQIVPFLLLGWPDSPVPSSQAFSAIFEGILRVPASGAYTIRVEADDGARVFLDDNLAGEGLEPNHPNSFEFGISLDAGDHPIRIDYVQFGGGNGLRVHWRQEGGGFQPIPPSALVPALP